MMTHVYRGKTLLDAKRTAFRELGDNAVIVTTRNVPRSGIAGFLGGAEFEVSAMTGESSSTPTYSRESKSPGPFSAGVYKNEPTKSQSLDELVGLRAQVRSELRVMKDTLAKGSSNDELFAEVSALRSMLEDLHSAAPAASDKIATVIRMAGIEGNAATILAGAARNVDAPANATAEDRVRIAIDALTVTAAWPLAGNEKTLIAVVGPSGVGKTTTAAKLAAQAIMRGSSVLLIAADTYRVGAVDQLARYADLLNAEMEVADDADALDEILQAATADVVIVDTAGRGAPAGDAVEHRLANEIEGRSRHVLLCLSASTRAADADRMTRAFSTARPTALVITKLDETSAPAGIVHACMASKLPVSTICFGQRVPEDIAQATTLALVDYLVDSDRGTK